MSRSRVARFGFIAVALLVACAAILVASLPSACGSIGRPSLDFAARTATVVAVVLWLASSVAAVFGTSRRVAPSVAAVAVVEAVALIALFLFYRHQTDWYDRCG